MQQQLFVLFAWHAVAVARDLLHVCVCTSAVLVEKGLPSSGAKVATKEQLQEMR